jgi:4-amino-4-deoxy-L-arabinose transferase-like glycosyltransferase
LLVAVLLAAALVRLVACFALPETRFPDATTYGQLARSIRDKGTLSDRFGNRAMVAPGYPLFVLACRATLGTSKFAYRLPQLVLGLLTVLGAFLLGRKLWGEAGGLLAGAFAALDPFAVYFESLELTEGPALCLLVWAALAAWTAREKLPAAAAAGALTALAALVRPGWLCIGAALFAAAMFVPGEDRPSEKRGWLCAALAAGVLVLVMSPWWIRNGVVLKAWVPLTTAGGQALFEGCSENATGAPDVPGTVGVRMRGIDGLDELERSAVLRSDARHWIRSNPGAFAGLALVKFGRTWSPVPNEVAHRKWYHMLASATNWAAVLVLAGAGLWMLKGRRGRALWCLIPALVVMLAHVFVVGSVRYRAPAWPFLGILAAGGGAALLGSFFRRAAPPPQASGVDETPGPAVDA